MPSWSRNRVKIGTFIILKRNFILFQIYYNFIECSKKILTIFKFNNVSDDFLRILLRFEKKRLGVCFRLNSFPPSRYIYFDYPPNHPMEDFYLALINRMGQVEIQSILLC